MAAGRRGGGAAGRLRSRPAAAKRGERGVIGVGGRGRQLVRVVCRGRQLVRWFAVGGRSSTVGRRVRGTKDLLKQRDGLNGGMQPRVPLVVVPPPTGGPKLTSPRENRHGPLSEPFIVAQRPSGSGAGSLPYRPCRASLATKRLPQINTYRGFSMSTTPLYTAVLRALERPNPTLFLGAGVGVRVGYPAWSDYLESLATACQTWNDPASATLIRQRVLREKYPEAATVYKTCDVIPLGERWKLLAQPFTRALTDSQTDLLVPLVSLPFSAIITTNYDHSLHQASVKKGRWFLPVEINDDTLRGTTFQREFFHSAHSRPR